MKACILIVEVSLIAMALEASLEEAGFATESVGTGEVALEALARNPESYQALVLGTLLISGGMDGWEVARRARQLKTDIPIVYVSADPGLNLEVNGVPNSALMYKPFPLNDLAAKLTEMLSATR